MRYSFSALIAISLSLPVAAAEPDFFVESVECKTLLTYMDAGEVKLVEADLPSYECIRYGNKIDCTITFQSGGRPRKGDKQTFTIQIDSPPILLFAVDNWSDSILVNTSKSTAAITSRRTDISWYGYKVCSAVFATKYQLDKMRELQRKSKP